MAGEHSPKIVFAQCVQNVPKLLFLRSNKILPINTFQTELANTWHITRNCSTSQIQWCNNCWSWLEKERCWTSRRNMEIEQIGDRYSNGEYCTSYWHLEWILTADSDTTWSQHWSSKHPGLWNSFFWEILGRTTRQIEESSNIIGIAVGQYSEATTALLHQLRYNPRNLAIIL